MTEITRSLPSDATPSAGARRVVSGSPAVLRELGRGFTLAGWAAIVLTNGVYGISVGWGFGPVLDFLVMALAGFLFVFLFDGLFTLLWKLLNAVLPRVRLVKVNRAIQAVPAATLGRLAGILLMVFGDLLWPESIFQYATLTLPAKFIVIAAALGGALLFAAWSLQRPATRYVLACLGVLPLVAVMAWLVWPGTADYVSKPTLANPPISAPALANPGMPGPLVVKTLSYGSGTDRRRAEYGEDAAIITPAIDGSTLIDAYDGLIGRYYRWFNGFDFSALPLNGLVWYPEGDGPFPLVLIVHGNHAMTEPSDPGYAYLAEHLASHGLIAVSVDENFLNGFALTDPDMTEIPLRGWLLLKHLEQWRDWNADPDNPFFGRVDLNRVGLIGHSRGGEAVAHAAEMNVRLVGRMRTVSRAEEFGFGIRSVIALAPCDHRYKPAGRALQLKNADYLLLATGHDGDMYYLDGLGQYARVKFDENPGGFKALAYLYRGNHGNFNTVWGDADKGWFNSALLNRAPLLSAEEQQQAAKVYITGFLEASLNEREEYRELFYNPAATSSWLPDDIIVTQYLDADFMAVDTNERGRKTDLDMPGGQAETRDIAGWQNAGRTLRDGETSVPNRGLRLEWTAGGDPAYTIELAEGASTEWELSPEHALSFTLANLMDAGTPGRVWIELESVGEIARLPLDQFGSLQPPLPARLTKADWIAALPSYKIDTVTPYERVDQTFDLPLSAFVAANPDFRPQQISAIRFWFDGEVDGIIMLDEIGFRAPLPAAP